MSNIHEQPDEDPTTAELTEPSTEKEPGEEPKTAHPEDPEPDHEAVGIGVIGGGSDGDDAEDHAESESAE